MYATNTRLLYFVFVGNFIWRVHCYNNIPPYNQPPPPTPIPPRYPPQFGPSPYQNRLPPFNPGYNPINNRPPPPYNPGGSYAPPDNRAPSYNNGGININNAPVDLRPPPIQPPYGQSWGNDKPPWVNQHPNYINNQPGGGGGGGYPQPPLPPYGGGPPPPVACPPNCKPNYHHPPPPGNYGGESIPCPPNCNNVMTTTREPTNNTPKPVDVMADIVNHLGSRILLDHVSVRGNFAFSPYGVTSVLCVIAEGSSDNSVMQIVNTLRLPEDPSTVRVGMRDLHRHLKSYFGHNGFLQGVDLSQNSTTLKDDFLPILRIYGYHIEDNETNSESSTPNPPGMTTTGSGEEGGGDEDGDTSTTMTPEDSDAGESNVGVVTEENTAGGEGEEQMQEVNMETTTEGNKDEISGDEQTEQNTESKVPPVEDSDYAGESNTEQSAPVDNEAAAKRRKRSTNSVLFPDIVLTNGAENSTNETEPEPSTQTRPFRLFSGTFTRPIPVIERKDLLPFASLPQLRAVAALLPLSELRYGLLILLPTDGRANALTQLARDLTDVPLRKILHALRPERMHSTIPAFSAKGPVALTSTLQQLGVWDIFDPRLAKLDKMSTDPGLYIRELEQNIKVDFRSIKSVQTRLHVDSRRVITARSAPEYVDAMRPFIYYIVDRYTHAALIAGKIEDPSSTRIF